MTMKHSTPTRRTVIAGTAAALATGTAVNVAAIATTGDHELHRLWSEYQARAEVFENVYDVYQRARDPFEDELRGLVPQKSGYLPEHRDTWKRLWVKYNLEPLSIAWNEASERLSETVRLIQATKATTLFGIAVKLAALPLFPEEDDYKEAARSTVADLDAMLRTAEFSAAFVVAAGEPFEGIQDDDEDQDPAVQS